MYTKLEEATTAVAKLYKETPGDVVADNLPRPAVYKSKEPLENISSNTKKGEKDIKVYDSRLKPVLRPLKKQPSVSHSKPSNGHVRIFFFIMKKTITDTYATC